MKKIIAAAVLALLPALALAQPIRAADDCAAQRARNPKAACNLSIGGEDVSGEVVAPTGDFSVVRQPPPMGSLIRVRTSFADKILASATNL